MTRRKVRGSCGDVSHSWLTSRRFVARARRGADDQPNAYQADTETEHPAHHVCLIATKRHANRDLARALGNRIRQHTVDTQRCDGRPHAREYPEHKDVEPRSLVECPHEVLFERFPKSESNLRVRRSNLTADQVHDRVGIVHGPYDQCGPTARETCPRNGRSSIRACRTVPQGMG
jgi:hypothetical protein